MVVISTSKKGFGFFGIIIPWAAWPGIIAGVGIGEQARRVTNTQAGTNANAAINLVTLVGGGLVSYYGIKAVKNAL